MAKRYGRNQKRAHRERIAELEALLRNGTGAPQPGDLALDSVVEVFDIDDAYRRYCKSYGFPQYEERSAEVEVAVKRNDAFDALMGAKAISFRGGRFVISGIQPHEERPVLNSVQLRAKLILKGIV